MTLKKFAIIIIEAKPQKCLIYNRKDNSMKCWECGKETEIRYYGFEWSGNKNWSRQYKNFPKREYCDACYGEKLEEFKSKKEQYVLLKKELMFERALKILDKQDIDVYEYQDIIKDMEEYVHQNPNKFDSSHEMIAGIILVYNEIPAKMQYKIDQYRADFYIPSLKIILEIDGATHSQNAYYDSKRDEKIREILGLDWEVVRISTQYLEQNAELLVEAIKTIKTEKQKLRKENYGKLPEWFSKREKAKRPKKTIVGDDFLSD